MREQTEDQVQENSAEGTAVEKAGDEKYKVTAGFENRGADDDHRNLIVWPADSLTAVQASGSGSECLALKPSRPTLYGEFAV